MYKPILLLSLLITLSISSFGQRHIKGQKVIYLEGGLSKLGGFGRAGGGLNTSNRTYLVADFMLETGKVLDFHFSTYNLTATFFGNPIRIKDIVYLSGGVGATANISSVQGVVIDENTSDSKNLNQFNYGLLGAVQVETFLSDRLVWQITGDQRWFISNKFGSAAWYAGTGIKFILQ